MKRMIPWAAAVILAVSLLLVLGMSADAQKKETLKAGTFKDVLVQHVGQKSSIGEVKKVAGDYIVVEDDLGTSTIPIAAIQCVRMVKGEEGAPPTLEIRLVSKD